MNHSSSVPSTLSIRMFILLVATALAVGQARKPVTTEALIQMKRVGLDEQTMIKAMETNGATIDTSAEGLVALKRAGIGDAVIRAALLARNTQVAQNEAPQQPAGEMAINEVGVHVMEGDKLRPLPAEIVKQRSTSPFKVMATGGFGTTKVNGMVDGGKSSVQLSGRSVVMVLRCPEGVAAEGYQLLILDAKKDRREFTFGKSSLIKGQSFGVESKDMVSTNFERIAPNTYKALLPALRKGEYGVYGSSTALGGQLGSIGKLYTFGIVD